MTFKNVLRPLRSAWLNLPSWLVPLFLVVALLLGGGGRGHPLVTAVIDLTALMLLAVELNRFEWKGRTIVFTLAGLLGAAWLLLVLAQMTPLPPDLWHGLPGREAAVVIYEAMGWTDAWHPLSLTPDATRETLISCIAPFAIFLAAAGTTREEAQRLLRIFLLIALASALLGILQFGVGSSGPFYIFDTAHRGSGVGLFINRNHQASFLLAALVIGAVPGVVLPQYQPGQGKVSRGGLLLILLSTLLAGAVLATTSRTGITLLPVAIIAAAAVAYLSGAANGHLPKLLIGVAIVGGALLPTPVVQQTLARFATVAEDQRQDYWSNTLVAIGQSFPAGTGLGSFRTIYPMVEPLEQISPLRVNNAHNDFLELALEAGCPGLLLLGLALGLILFAVGAGIRPGQPAWRRGFSLAAGASFFILLAFSVVDYPLRMTSIMVLAAMLLGLLARKGGEGRAPPALPRRPQAWLTGVLVLLAAWQVLAGAWSNYLALEGDGAGASASAPWRAQGWSMLADKADLAGHPEAGIAPARRALAIAPLDAVAVRALGLGLLAQGHDESGNALLEAGARLGWREGVNQYWLVDRALAFGAYEVAIQRLDALLRLDRAAGHQLDRLAALADAPEGRKVVITALSVRPGWRQAFFNTLAERSSVPVILAVLKGVNATAAPVRPSETALIRWKLADHAQWAAIRSVWAESHGGALLGEGDFSLDPEALKAGGPPLGWRAPALPGAHALIAEPDIPWRGEALMVTSDGLARGTVLAQGLVLEPGHYRLSLLAQRMNDQAPGVQWRIACEAAGEGAAALGIVLRWRPARDNWQQGEGQFSIGSDCPAQVLMLELSADQERPGSFFLDDVAIESINPLRH